MVKFNLEDIEEVLMDGTIGFCTACGSEADCVEPDARGYTCEVCGEDKVYGAQELLFMGLVEGVE
jgi:hypothetical protein